jgi:hypothetical protein
MFNMIDKSTFDPPGDTTSPLPNVLDGSFWDFARNEWPWGHSNSEVEEAGSRAARALLRRDSDLWLQTSGFSTSTSFCRCWRCKRLRQP